MEAPADSMSPRTSEREYEIRVEPEKQECTCEGGCTCGQSPCTCQSGNCPVHGNAFVLPVRYDTSGDFVAYDYPERYRRSTDLFNRLLRTYRQATDKAAEAINGPTLDHHITKIREHFENRRQAWSDAAARGRENFRGTAARAGDTLKKISDTTKDGLTNLGSTLGTFTKPMLDHASEFMKNFGSSSPSTRRRRSTSDDRTEADKRIPVLRVKQHETKCDEYEQLKRLSESRVELRAPEMKSSYADKYNHCYVCGAELTSEMCKCGAHQPQYVEFIDGKPVSFYPGAVQKDSTVDSPRYVYDRYGHKYVERSGGLHLVTFDYQKEPIVKRKAENVPDYDCLAYIMHENKEIMRQLNPFPGTHRIVPETTDLVDDAIHYVKDLARRDVTDEKKTDDEKSERKTDEERVDEKERTDERDEDDKRRSDDNAEEKSDDRAKRSENSKRTSKPESVYQVLPMKYDGKDGKVLLKVYSSNDDNESRDWTKNAQEKESVRSEPTVKKFSKNNKDYEVYSFNRYGMNTDEEVRQILRHLHGKH